MFDREETEARRSTALLSGSLQSHPAAARSTSSAEGWDCRVGCQRCVIGVWWKAEGRKGKGKRGRGTVTKGEARRRGWHVEMCLGGLTSQVAVAEEGEGGGSGVVQRASLCPHPVEQVSLVVANVSTSTGALWKPFNLLT